MAEVSRRGPASRFRMPPALMIVLVLHAAWSAAYIAASSGIVAGRRTFLLFDDTMVSMRYARHAAAGHGLVWNPGERVEGFSNPLWTLAMSALHRLPLPAAWMSLPVQAAGWVLTAGMIGGVWRLVALAVPGSRGAPLVGALLVAGSLSLNRWALLGTETAPLALITTAMALLTTGRGDRTASLAALAAVACLVRMDGALIGMGFILADVFGSRRDRRRALAVGAAIAGALAAQTAWRWVTYGDLLPNTYWLKMTGYPVADRVARGAAMLGALLTTGGGLLAAPALAGVPWRSLPLARRLASIVVLHAAYSVWVGGDAWDGWGGVNRFLAPAAPAFLALVAIGWASWRAVAWRRLAPAAWLIGFNAFGGTDSLAEWTLRAPPFGSADNLAQGRLADRIAALTAPDATIAVVRAGTLPYLLDRPCVDLLGKCDRRIARLPAHRGIGFHPGHLKWDYAWSIGERRPDVIIQLWYRPQEAAREVRAYRLVALTEGLVMFRRGSTRVNWRALRRAPFRLTPTGPRGG